MSPRIAVFCKAIRRTSRSCGGWTVYVLGFVVCLVNFPILRGLDPARFRAVLDRLGMGGKADKSLWNRDMRLYSDGQKKKMLLAAGLCAEAHLYVWDEPLNFLDIEAREQIENALLAAGPTLVFVEHDRAFTERVATDKLDLQAFFSRPCTGPRSVFH